MRRRGGSVLVGGESGRKEEGGGRREWGGGDTCRKPLQCEKNSLWEITLAHALRRAQAAIT
jgi:hypothetical protein